VAILSIHDYHLSVSLIPLYMYLDNSSFTKMYFIRVKKGYVHMLLV